jgi:hypothetical protein
MSQLLEEHLGDPAQAGPVLEALLGAACWDFLLGTLQAALRSLGEGGGTAADPALASPHATTEQELVALLSVVQVGLQPALTQTCRAWPLTVPGQGCRGMARRSERQVQWATLLLRLPRPQVACMVHPAAKRSMCEGGIMQLFLDRLSAAQPALACACLDTLLSLQLNHPPAFHLLVELRGVQQASAGFGAAGRS